MLLQVFVHVVREVQPQVGEPSSIGVEVGAARAVDDVLVDRREEAVT